MTHNANHRPSHNHWAIVGGGMLGLTLAHRLRQAGEQVTLLEAAPDIGGLAGAWQLGDMVWDRHYHVTLLSDMYLRNLLGELKLEQSMKWVETKTGFYTDGQLYSMSNSWEFLRFPPLSFIEKLRLGATIFYASKIRDWRRLEGVHVADWLRKWSGDGTFQKIWLPLLQAKLGETYRRVSASFIWATIARMYRARQSGLKKEMFGYVPGGYAHVFQCFAERLQAGGVQILTEHPVRGVTSHQDGRVQIDCGNEGVRDYDRVVVTVPSPMAASILPGLSNSLRNQYDQVQYLGILCPSLLMKRSLSPYYVTNITDRPVPFTAVIEMTTLVDRNEFSGRHLVYLPKYVALDDPAWQMTDEQIREQFLMALERMYPEFCRDDVEAFRVSRAKHVMALPTLHYSEKLPSMQTTIPNVWAINSAHIVKGTLNVNEVVELAENAFQEHLLPMIESNACHVSCGDKTDKLQHAIR